MSIAKKQLEVAKVGGVIELGAEQDFEKAELKNVGSALNNLAIQYSLMLADELKKKDAASSGELADSILPLEVQVNGQTFSVQIQTKAYASFIDEGVDGWAKSRGSRFKFKTKGVNPQGEMVKSVSDWLEREGKMASTKYNVLHRKGKSANDFKIQRATSTAYLIKRFGIKATHFWRDATDKFKDMIEKELGIAVKIDIINNIVK